MGNYVQSNAFPLHAAQTRGGMSIGHHLLPPSPAWGTHSLPGAYMSQVEPAHDPGRRVAPSMRHQSPVPNSQARGNGRKRSVYTVDCLVRFRNRYIDRFRLSQNGPPESLTQPGSYRRKGGIYTGVAQWRAPDSKSGGWGNRAFHPCQGVRSPELFSTNFPQRPPVVAGGNMDHWPEGRAVSS